MKKTIWKFKLEAKNTQEIKMPKNAEILHVSSQYDKICIWVLVNPIATKETRTFEVFGTGHSVIDDIGVSREYIGTAKLHSETTILHIFERIY